MILADGAVAPSIPLHPSGKFCLPAVSIRNMTGWPAAVLSRLCEAGKTIPVFKVLLKGVATGSINRPA
jgi:hypothetical protein